MKTTDRASSPVGILYGYAFSRPVAQCGPHADPAQAPLLLPDRLARAVDGDPLWAGAGPLRELWATARADGLPHLGAGRWWDAEAGRWRDGWGRWIRVRSDTNILGRARRTHVALAAAHRDHDTANNADANLAAFCQRCHTIHDRPEHQRRRWRTLFRRKAVGDLFGGPYA
jgi:hypothetical protein